MIEVLNLGAGVQSSTVLLMSIRGQLPKLDHVIFADTGWEPAAVYRQLDNLRGECECQGIKFHLVSNGNIREDSVRYQQQYKRGQIVKEDLQVQKGLTEDGKSRWGSMPLFVLNNNAEQSHGQIRRQCTYEYKIRPIERCIRREILGLAPRQRAPVKPVIRQWFGISTDEVYRIKSAPNKYTENYYPLIEKRMSRSGCHAWLEDHGYPPAPRSACIGCPYRSQKEWRRLTPEEFASAVEFDEGIREMGGMKGTCYLHSSRKPLAEVNLWTDQDENQLPLFADECEGMCGL